MEEEEEEEEDDDDEGDVKYDIDVGENIPSPVYGLFSNDTSSSSAAIIPAPLFGTAPSPCIKETMISHASEAIMRNCGLLQNVLGWLRDPPAVF